jgi:hypothetical protein
MADAKFLVEASHILMFARAVGDANPIYHDPDYASGTEPGGIIAPPTFPQASAQFQPDYRLRPKIGEPWFGSGATPSGTLMPPGGADPGSAAGSPDAEESEKGGGDSKPSGAAAGGLHAEQHFNYHRQLRPGDVLSITTRPGKTWEKQGKRAGKLVFSETITEYRDAGGELVVTARGVGVRTERVIEQD